MKFIKRLLVILFVFVHTTSCKAELAISFSFLDNNGRKYSSSSLEQDFQKNFGIKFSPIIIFINPDIDGKKYKIQEKEINEIERVFIEDNQVIIIYSRSYFVPKAAYLLDSTKIKGINYEEKEFQIMIFGRSIKLLVNSNDILPHGKIITMIKNAAN